MSHERRAPGSVVMLDLDDTFGSGVLFNDWIEPGATAFGFEGVEVELKVQDWRAASVRQATDNIKLFVATSQFDPSVVALDALLGPRRTTNRVVVRPSNDAFWGTTRVRVVTAR